MKEIPDAVRLIVEDVMNDSAIEFEDQAIDAIVKRIYESGLDQELAFIAMNNLIEEMARERIAEKKQTNLHVSPKADTSAELKRSPGR